MSAYDTHGLRGYLDPTGLADIHAHMEAREAVIKDNIENDRERMEDAMDSYLDPHRVRMDGHDLLMTFIPALARSKRFMDAIAKGDEIPDCELPAFRILLAQIAEAGRHYDEAIADAVNNEMLR